MKRFKLFLFNSSILIITSIIFRIIDIYFTSFVASKVGSENMGIFQLVMSVYLFGITLATSGINLSVTRVVSEELALGNSGSISKIMKHSLFITILTSSTASFLFYINSNFIVTYCLHGKVTNNVIYLICLALPLISMSSAISGYFAGVRRIYKNAIGQFFEHTSKVIITAYILMHFLPNGLEYSCFSLILGDVISEIISFCYIYIIYKLDIKKYKSTLEAVQILNSSNTINTNTYNNIFSSSYSKKLIRISVPVAITSYIRSGLNTFKQLIIPKSLEKSGIDCAKSLSNYGLINGMALPIILFPDILVKSFASLLIPEFSRYHAKKDKTRIIKITKLLLLAIFSASIFLAIFLYIFADKLSFLLYKNTSTGIYIKLLSPLAIFIYVDTVVDSMLRGLDKQVGVMVINILDLVISTSFIYFAVPKLGLTGYIISIYISEILNFSASLFELWKVVRKSNHSI